MLVSTHKNNSKEMPGRTDLSFLLRKPTSLIESDRYYRGNRKTILEEGKGQNKDESEKDMKVNWEIGI